MIFIDTVIANLSDMHSGGSTALFTPFPFGDENQNHSPSVRQLRIFEVFERFAAHVAWRREGKRLVVVHNGDAIEGMHHNTIQVSLTNRETQSKLHVELMDIFLKSVGFDPLKGDRLFYTRGTNAHTEEYENKIAADLGAEKTPMNTFVRDHFELRVNGRRIWFLHHGKKRGSGPNEGNALRNWLRDIYYDCQKVEVIPPDVIITGHTHAHTYEVKSFRVKDGFREMRGIILPSWQEKTRFAWQVVPVEKNDIGGCALEITAAGDIRVPNFIVKETEPVEVVTI